MVDDEICDNCDNFIEGSVKDDDKMSNINPRNEDVDRCIKTHYKVTRWTWCILDLFRKKEYY